MPHIPNKLPVGLKLLQDPFLNKGTAFTEAERDKLKLRGRLPPRNLTMEQQCAKVLESFRSWEIYYSDGALRSQHHVVL
jgi:malate dehydrogenase (oxaloacetate-decarboxylating)(NADP+)